MKPAIVVRGLGKRFQRPGADRPTSFKEALLAGLRGTRTEWFWGLRDISFSVPRGRTVGLIGRNGAGKSTLLRMIGGVGRPDEGLLEVRGRIGALLDIGAGMTDDLTGRENVMIAGVIAGMTRAEVKQRFEDIVRFAELERFIDAPIRTYSTGMRMRLAFAVAAHIDPDILLIDEVLAVGDAAFQRKCLERIAEFKAAGCTIFLVSHDPAQIRALCDEVIFLRQGKLIATGPTDEILGQYENAMSQVGPSADAADVPDVALDGGRKLRMNVNRFGTQDAQITGVKLLTLQGVPTSSVVCGAGLIVELDYTAGPNAPSPRAAVSIYLSDGTCCYDTNTGVAELDLPGVSGSGQLRLSIERLDLAAGDYFVNVGLYERNWDHTYDTHALVYPLHIVGAGSDKGLLNPPARWDLLDHQEGRDRTGQRSDLRHIG